MKYFRIIWVIIPVLIVIYLIYQNSYTDYFSEKEVMGMETEIAKDKTLIVIAEEENFTMRKKGFEKLFDSLQFWYFENDNKELILKEESLAPTENTPMLFMYNRSTNSFENQKNVIPINNFPYTVNQNNVNLNLLNYDKNGNVYFVFREKKIVLKPGETYKDIWLDGLSMKNVVVENIGFVEDKNIKIEGETEK